MRFATAFVCGGAAAVLAVTACSALLDTSVLTDGSGHAGTGTGGGQANGGTDAPNGGGPDGTGGSAPAGGDAGSEPGGGSAGLGATGGDETGGNMSGGGIGGTGGTSADAGAAGTPAEAGGGTGGAACVPSGSVDYCDGLDNDCNPATHDVCPSGCVASVFGGHGYMACQGDPVYADAEAACVKQHMHLVKIENAAENAFVLSTLKANALGQFIWMGGTDAVKARTFVWPDGSTLTKDGVVVTGMYANFGSGEPASGSGTKCLQFTNVTSPPPGSWTDTPCTEKQPYICERYAPFPP